MKRKLDKQIGVLFREGKSITGPPKTRSLSLATIALLVHRFKTQLQTHFSTAQLPKNSFWDWENFFLAHCSILILISFHISNGNLWILRNVHNFVEKWFCLGWKMVWVGDQITPICCWPSSPPHKAGIRGCKGIHWGNCFHGSSIPERGESVQICCTSEN